MNFKDRNLWALVLGGSSGFGLATAKKLSSLGMNICVVHRDRRGAMARIEKEFEDIKKSGVEFVSFNADALSAEGRSDIQKELAAKLGGKGKIRLLMHSIAFGNLKLVAPQKKNEENPVARLAQSLGVAEEQVKDAANKLFEEGVDEFINLADPPEYNNDLFIEEEDLHNTVFSMGTSMLVWTQEIFRLGLFDTDARVLGMTSEGNEIAWRGYAAVSAAKVAMEAVSRAIAKEFAAHGIRSNIVQAGVTETPALRLIPGNKHLVANARLRNPFRRLTRPEDVANAIALLSSDEAAWINGDIIRVDGGEHISG